MQESHNRIKCEIANVVLAKEAHFFVVVQLKDPNSQHSVKYRTDIAGLVSRPKFIKNLFTFLVEEHSYTLKLALMAAKSELEKDATKAMVQGVCSVPISQQRLKELPNSLFQEHMVFTDRGKEVGQFTLKVQLEEMLQDNAQPYDPLVSRVLYTEDCSDPVRLENSIKMLESKLKELYASYQKIKSEENYFEKIYFDLEHDQREIMTEIDSVEQVNSKIEHRLEEKENLENLKIEISMLEQSTEGKRLLFEKVEYFQDRIYREMEENEKLSIQYKKLRPVIEKNLKKAEEQAEKLKGKQLQEFELANNEKILASYDDLLYQFKCHEETIKSLMKMSGKSELTSQQAKFLLSQVSYEIKLSEYEHLKDEKQSLMLEQIEREMAHRDREEAKELSEEEEVIHKIKLNALQKEINAVRQKISRLNQQPEY